MNQPSSSRVSIRSAVKGDAGALLALKQALDRETRFMMLEPSEREGTVDDERAAIEWVLARDNATILVAEASGEIVGYIEADGGMYRRNRHSAYLIAGVRQGFAGKGIGRQLVTEVERWAGEHGIHRFELTVMAHNQHAVALYSRMGFVAEGTRRDSLLVEGHYVDEYLMSKLLACVWTGYAWRSPSAWLELP